MSIIKNLKTDENGWFANGTFTSKSLFKGEMKVCIFIDDGATEQDAGRCISHYNDLLSKKEIISDLKEKVANFFLYMYNEWGLMNDIYDNIFESLKPIMKAYKNGDDLISYLYNPVLYATQHLENEVGYCISCECPWEPEHQCSIIIRNDELLYVGPVEGFTPWEDEEDYYCIWNDNSEDN